MQQRVPLAVLKQTTNERHYKHTNKPVATARTACGIETLLLRFCKTVDAQLVATARTACGIETSIRDLLVYTKSSSVATARTACGIETLKKLAPAKSVQKLQQRVPLAVLKQFTNSTIKFVNEPTLQQRVPLAVLKH